MPDRLMTEADYLKITDDTCKHELVAGVIVAEPFPAPRHDRVRSRLERMLHDHVDTERLGEVFGDTGFVLARNPDTIRGPDISFVSRERLSAFDATRYFRGAPDLAIEILSPSNRPGEMHGKVADYFAAGARMVWVVDPERRSVTTYRTLLAPRRLEADETLDGEDVVPGFGIQVAAITDTDSR
jgi:Uma2 family endonuclease